MHVDLYSLFSGKQSTGAYLSSGNAKKCVGFGARVLCLILVCAAHFFYFSYKPISIFSILLCAHGT